MSAAASPPLFALLIPGRCLSTSFVPISATKLMIDVPSPESITEMSVCMLQPSVPDTHGIAVHYALEPFAEWQYLGALSLAYPTASFRAVWRSQLNPSSSSTLRIGLSVETNDAIAQMTTADARDEGASLDSAQGIAKDLYQYMASYSSTTGQYGNLGRDVLVIPTNCIDKWFDKFKHKHLLEPFFWMKKKDLRTHE